jgi:hypothetical protein
VERGTERIRAKALSSILKGDSQMKKLIVNTTYVLLAAFFLWVAVSFAEVNMKNHDTDPQYWDGNFFVVCTGYDK